METQRGTLPVLLVASHGGTEWKVTGTTLKTDLYTAELVREWSHQIREQIHPDAYPSFCIIKVHKSYMNLNRPLKDQPTEEARVLWKKAHTWMEEEYARWGGRLFLFDIHGHSSGRAGNPDIIYRGTYNGQSFRATPEWEERWIESGARNKLAIEPPSWLQYTGEARCYRGGYITQNYPNAIQWELPFSIRKNPNVFIETMIEFLFEKK